MVKAYIRTEMNHCVRRMVVEFESGGKAELWGDPAKVVASLLIFGNSTVGSWVCGKGLKVEATEETCEALRVLSRRRLTWREAAKHGFLNNPTPQHVLQVMALKVIME